MEVSYLHEDENIQGIIILAEGLGNEAVCKERLVSFYCSMSCGVYKICKLVRSKQ